MKPATWGKIAGKVTIPWLILAVAAIVLQLRGLSIPAAVLFGVLILILVGEYVFTGMYWKCLSCKRRLPTLRGRPADGLEQCPYCKKPI